MSKFGGGNAVSMCDNAIDKDKCVPDVSIIIPVYKTEKYLRSMVDSAINQTHKNIEIILVDDGSPDSSGKICDELAAEDERVRVIHKRNEGVGEARNTGLASASGEYIYFADSDDILSPDLVKENLELARKNDADVVIFGLVRRIVGKNGEIRERLQCPERELVLSFPQVCEIFPEVISCYPAACIRLLRRKFLLDNEIKYSKMPVGEDDLFNINIIKARPERIVFNPKAYYYYYLRSGSAMGTYRSDIFDGQYFLASELEKTVAELKIEPKSGKMLTYRYYVKAVSMTMGLMSEKSCPLSRREKLELVKKYMSMPKIAEAFEKVDLGIFGAPLLKIKILLLKKGHYNSAVLLGELKRKFMKE